FLENDESNKMKMVDNSFIFEPDVIVGFVSGGDPIFSEYKKIIGEFYLTPIEAYSWYCERKGILLSTENLSVVTYILPINKKTKEENFKFSRIIPSERWANTRLFGEQANVKTQTHLIEELKKLGINAMAPTQEKSLFKINSKIWASNWSHRHCCFASGLGSFGLSDGFINSRGKAMRCGSIIVDYTLPSDAAKRPSDPYEYCINCGDCIDRCPVNAITSENRHDKIICSNHVRGTVPYIKKNYGINIYGCGLCQVGVSCENEIPKKPS
ncbi:MAG: 4Fe-4S double cluster binding domain-containing protein, partial [Promethearchaeota archaeon]